MDFWDRLAEVQARHDVLQHPFYRRWSAGELTRQELACYAGEYRHAVVALADASELSARAAEPTQRERLAAHAAEEREHVALWDRFAAAVGAEVPREPLPETEACVSEWSAERPLLELLVSLYAIEAAQPAISQTKREGLRAFYDVTETSYFDVHVERDVEHAQEDRELIEERLACADHDRLLEVAGRVLSANWELLDGVDRVAAVA
jgi:pyrroloquinoline-quinone synthase